VLTADVLASGEPVPSLGAALEAATLPLVLELKCPGDGAARHGERLAGDALEARRSAWHPFVARVLGLLEDYPEPVVLASFAHGALAAARAAGDRPVAVLADGPGGLAVARDVDAEAVHLRASVVLDARAGDGDGPVAAGHADGRAVHAWTVRTWHRAARLVDAGVDGITADYPGLLRFA